MYLNIFLKHFFLNHQTKVIVNFTVFSLGKLGAKLKINALQWLM